MIMVDRGTLKNPNGLILGTPGSGKSFSAKREITNSFLITDNDIIICDPEAEYAPIVEALGGTVVNVAPTSEDHINPLDINLNYADGDDPVMFKASFILSLFELILRQNINRVWRQRKARRVLFVGGDHALVTAAKILAITAPTAIEANVPFATDRKLHVVALVGFVAKIDNDERVVTSSAVLPAMKSDHQAVVVSVKKRRRLSSQTARMTVAIVAQI